MTPERPPTPPADAESDHEANDDSMPISQRFARVVSALAAIAVLGCVTLATVFPSRSLFVVTAQTDRFAYTVRMPEPSSRFARIPNAIVIVDNEIPYPECGDVAVKLINGSRWEYSLAHGRPRIAIPGATPFAMSQQAPEGKPTASKHMLEIVQPKRCDPREVKDDQRPAAAYHIVHGVDAEFGLTTRPNDQAASGVATPSHRGRAAGEALDGQIQAYSRSIFCVDLPPLLRLDDCTLHPAYAEPLPIPPGVGIEARDRCRGIWDCFSQTAVRSTAPTPVHGVVRPSQEPNDGFDLLISMDAQVLRIAYPVASEAQTFRRPDTFQVDIFRQLLVEPIMALLAALVGGGFKWGFNPFSRKQWIIVSVGIMLIRLVRFGGYGLAEIGRFIGRALDPRPTPGKSDASKRP